MNARIIAILLLLATLGLGIGLYIKSEKATEERNQLSEKINSLSNEWVNTTQKLNQREKENATLSTNLTQRVEDLNLYSNKWTFVTGELTKAENEAKAAAAASKAEMEKRDLQISNLTGEKDELTKNMNDLTNRIGTLQGQIVETERKLTQSEGDRESLRKELKRLLAEKAELERKFNDLSILREQVKKLREELAIARRLDFIKRGLYGFDKKGAQLLNEGVHSPGKSTITNGQYNLNVDVKSTGEATVVPSTNAPAK